MSPLALLITITLGFGALAIVLWAFLLLHRITDNRRIRRRETLAGVWLEKLLYVLEEQAGPETLPRIRSALEMETVLGLLRDLAERFRGQYREDLSRVLKHIGAEAYAFKLLAMASATSRVRGCTLLAWIGPSETADNRLDRLLTDRSANVRLEACCALAVRSSASVSLVDLLGALRGTDSLRSERVRDIIRFLAPTHSDEIATLLDEAQSSREMVLLLEGVAHSGDLAHTGKIAVFLSHPDAPVRAAAVGALEVLADPSHEDAVLRLAGDIDRGVRLEVAKYASIMAQQSSGSRVLEELSNDPDFDVQRTAVYGLVRLGGERLENFRSAPNPPIVEALIAEAFYSLQGELHPLR